MPNPDRYRLGARWMKWGRNVGLGYSFRHGNVRGELEPKRNLVTGLVEWEARLWLGRDRDNVVFRAWDPSPLRAAAAAEAEAARMERAGEVVPT